MAWAKSKAIWISVIHNVQVKRSPYLRYMYRRENYAESVSITVTS